MDTFARGSLPAIPVPPGQPTTRSEAPGQAATAATSPRRGCDLASTCPTCGTMMQPEHAHYRCLTCGYRDSCCF
ncbi:MAG: hypothetical protein KBG28_09380 [Kofleriaceae bacterium]|jgi:hypothetical protein|nr:hypothetical protein [Kofleriaceae bacterium]